MDYDTTVLGDREVNRRIAPRTPVERLFVDVVYDQPRSFGRRRVQRLTVQVVDVSVEGALLQGPDRRELRAGAVLAVVAPGRAIAEVRHHAAAEGGTAQYGVRFVSMDESFRAVLFDHVGRNRESMRDAWLHAR